MMADPYRLINSITEKYWRKKVEEQTTYNMLNLAIDPWEMFLSNKEDRKFMLEQLGVECG